MTINPLLRRLKAPEVQGNRLSESQRKVARQAALVMFALAGLAAGLYLILGTIEPPLIQIVSAGFLLAGGGMGVYFTLRCLSLVESSFWTRFYCWWLIFCVAAVLASLSVMLEVFTPTGSMALFLLAGLLGSTLMCLLFGTGLVRTDCIEQRWFPATTSVVFSSFLVLLVHFYCLKSGLFNEKYFYFLFYSWAPYLIALAVFAAFLSRDLAALKEVDLGLIKAGKQCTLATAFVISMFQLFFIPGLVLERKSMNAKLYWNGHFLE